MNLSPFNRQNKFFSEREFQYYLEQSREHLAGINTSFYFIKVNKEQSQIDDLYGESYVEEISYEDPIEIPAIVKLNESENKSYVDNKGLVRFEEYGNLLLHVLLADLEALNADITYGDFIGYRVSETQVLYFEVSNDAQKSFENNKSFAGYKYFWKTITCAPTNYTFDIE